VKNQYLCDKINEILPEHGKPDHTLWQKAAKTHRFVDVVGGNHGLYDTKAAMLLTSNI